MSAQTKSEDVVSVRIPRNIYDWLNETAQRMGLTADDVASMILGQFWEINRTLVQPTPRIQIKPVEDLTNKLALIKKYKSLIRRFLTWTEGKGLTDQDLTREHINMFLNEYITDNSLSKNIKTKYRYVLSTYIKLVKEHGLSRKEILGER
jgi:hypothetical protein